MAVIGYQSQMDNWLVLFSGHEQLKVKVNGNPVSRENLESKKSVGCKTYFVSYNKRQQIYLYDIEDGFTHMQPQVHAQGPMRPCLPVH